MWSWIVRRIAVSSIALLGHVISLLGVLRQHIAEAYVPVVLDKAHGPCLVLKRRSHQLRRKETGFPKPVFSLLRYQPFDRNHILATFEVVGIVEYLQCV